MEYIFPIHNCSRRSTDKDLKTTTMANIFLSSGVLYEGYGSLQGFANL